MSISIYTPLLADCHSTISYSHLFSFSANSSLLYLRAKTISRVTNWGITISIFSSLFSIALYILSWVSYWTNKKFASRFSSYSEKSPKNNQTMILFKMMRSIFQSLKKNWKASQVIFWKRIRECSSLITSINIIQAKSKASMYSKIYRWQSRRMRFSAFLVLMALVNLLLSIFWPAA